MPITNPFPLEIIEKVNSPALLAWFEQFGEEGYLSAVEINTIVQALNYLYENSSPGLSKTPVNIRVQYNGTSVTVPSGFTLTRIVSQNDINTAFTGTVTGTSLVITDGVQDDIYLIDGYTN